MSAWHREHPELIGSESDPWMVHDSYRKALPRIPTDDERDAAPDLSYYAEDAGIDTTVCEFCHEPLDHSEPWRRGMDGCGAHERCLKGWL